MALQTYPLIGDFAGRMIDAIANTPASTPQVFVDHLLKTVRAADAAGDLFYGLKAGTNGTGPTMRREGIGERSYTWICSDGAPALGLTLIPASTSDEINTNPWGGRPLSADGGRI